MNTLKYFDYEDQRWYSFTGTIEEPTDEQIVFTPEDYYYVITLGCHIGEILRLQIDGHRIIAEVDITTDEKVELIIVRRDFDPLIRNQVRKVRTLITKEQES